MAFTNEDVQEIKEIVLETIEEESDPIEEVQQVSELSDGDEVPIVRSSQGVNSYRRAPVNLFGGGGGVVIVNNLSTGGATKALSAEMGRVLKNMIPTSLSQLPDDTTHRTVTDSEKTKWNDKYTKTEVNNLISSAPESDVIVVEVPSGSDIATYLLNNVPAAQRPNNIFRVPGTTSYSEWAWDGTKYIMLANKDYGFDDEPTPESRNLITSGAVASNLGYSIENPEFLRVYTDSDGRFLLGIMRDGNIVFGAGVPQQIKDYVLEKIDEIDFSDIIQGIEQQLDQKVDKEEGKSLINKDYADGVTYIEKPEFAEVKIDANRCVLWGLKSNGIYEFYANLEFKSKLLGHINYEDVITKDTNNYPGWAEVVLGGNSEFVAGIRDDGEFTWSKGIPPHLKKAFDYAWSGSHDFNILSVKKDGTGDFTNIQEAINSINDASVVNQYEVQVYDDFYINDLTELWEVHNPTVHSSSEPDVFVSYITTKDFVHLRGMGGKREIYVESPDINMPGSCFKNIHPIFVKGSCKIENFVFKVKGGRYAIHQDMSAYKYGVDSFKTTIYKNIDAIHYGNSMYTNGSGWIGAYAQANGFANGQTQIYINVNWITYDGNNGFYGHTNDQYTLPSRVYFLNCKCLSLGSLKTPGSNDCYLADRYSCQNNEVYIWGCDFPRFSGRAEGAGAINDNFMGYAPKKRGTKRYCLNTITGSNNKPMVVGIEYGRVLCFVTKNESEKIDVIGGTAKDDIWGLTFKKIEGTSINGIAYGGNYITPGVYSQVHNLSYILGNCRDNPKTLVVRLTDSNNNSTDYTIVFDENYMTEDGSDYSYNTTPYISQSSIISTINETFGDYFTIGDRMEIIDTFIDCKETVINGGNNAIKRGMAVVRNQEDGFRSWRRANGGENPDGFAMVDIGINGYGEVLLKEKNLFHINVLNVQSVSTGNYYKVGNNGFLVQTNDSSEAIMIAIENNVLSNFKK